MHLAVAVRRAAVAAVAATAVVLLLGVVMLALGYRVSPVLTGSMAPTYGPGDAVVTRMVPVQSLRVGMIALIVPPGETAPFAHRIASISGPAGAPVVTTKGDANPTADAWHERIAAPRVPVVVATVPYVGRPLTWIHGRTLGAALLCAFGLLVTWVGARLTVVSTRRSPSHATA